MDSQILPTLLVNQLESSLAIDWILNLTVYIDHLSWQIHFENNLSLSGFVLKGSQEETLDWGVFVFELSSRNICNCIFWYTCKSRL